MMQGHSQPPAESCRVSVIIPCRDHAKELDACLDSLIRQNYPDGFEIIVVDSASDDEVLAVCQRHADVSIVRDRRGLLPGEARNLGARHAKGKWLVFIDADCVAQPCWLHAIVEPLNNGARMVGGAIDHIMKWHPISVIDNMMQFSAQSPRREAGWPELIASCNIAISKIDFDVVGGFPDVPGVCGEDVLFCYALNRNWPGGIYFNPLVRVLHFGRASWRQLWQHQYRLGEARGQLMLALSARQRSIASHGWAMPAVVAKRLIWLSQRAARNHSLELFKLLLFFPVLMVGLIGWSLGFSRGCRGEPYRKPNIMEAKNGSH